LFTIVIFLTAVMIVIVIRSTKSQPLARSTRSSWSFPTGKYISMDHGYATACIPTSIDEWCEYVASGDSITQLSDDAMEMTEEASASAYCKLICASLSL
jgi:hypothetical protein